MNNKKTGMIEIHLSVFLVGLAGLFGKLISAPAYFIVFGRMFLAAVVLSGYILATKRNFKLARGNDFFRILFTGVLLAVHWFTFFYSIQISTVAIGLLSFSSFPIFTAFLEPAIIKEKVRKTNIYSAFIVFAGISLIVPEIDFRNNLFLGVLWGALSGLAYSLLSIENRILVRRNDSTKIVFYQNLIGAAVILPFIFGGKIDLNSQNIFYLLILGLFCTALAHSLFVSGLKSAEAQTAGIISALEPLYGILFAFLILGEIPEIKTFFGGALIIAGIIIASKFGKEGHDFPQVI